jgi:hypothetical protein
MVGTFISTKLIFLKILVKDMVLIKKGVNKQTDF